MKKLTALGLLTLSMLTITECSVNQKEDVYYRDLIDLFSSMTFDYANPNYWIISLQSTDSYVYTFDSRQTYNLISFFNNIPLKICIDKNDSKYDELSNQIVKGIDIEVGYKYSNQSKNTNDAIVHFYVLENGTVCFLDNRKITLAYSNPDVIEYEVFKAKIINMGGTE